MNHLALSLLRYDSPLGVLIEIVLYAFVMAFTITILARRLWRRERQSLEQLSHFLVDRGWQPTLALPDDAAAALVTTEFPIQASYGDYTCTHKYSVQQAMLHLGVARWAEGRTSRRDTVIVATAELRAPIECLVTANLKPKELSLGSYWMVRLPRASITAPDLYVHFHKQHTSGDQRVVKTLRIVESLFAGAADLFPPASVALLAPNGLVVRGPQLNTDRYGLLTVERMVGGAEHLLDRHKYIWAENS